MKKGIHISKPAKYRAVPQQVDGIRFASKAEARRYQELKLLQQTGQIYRLETHPSFPIHINGVHVCRYIADFRYVQKDGQYIIEDVKGVLTPVCRLKLKLMEVVYNIMVTLVRER